MAFLFLAGLLGWPAAGGAEALLTLEPNAPPRIEAGGAPGQLLQIEAASDLDRSWEVLASLVLTNDLLRWPDAWAGGSPRRFYRVTRSAPGALPFGENFRLTDHQGKSRELYYYSGAEEIKAVVLIFAASGCEEIARLAPVLKALRDKLQGRGVLFWMIHAQPGQSRNAIAAEAAKLGLDFPVFDDRAQTVARRYHARTAGEVVCVDRASLRVFYRGAVDDRAAARFYLEEALEAHLAGRAYELRQTKAPGCDLPEAPAEPLSYSADIAPILQAKCVTCHIPGSAAPWAMTSHGMVQTYAAAMLEEISAKRMPPWHADPEYGKFKNDISLTVEEERKLVQWLMAGSPRGSGPDPLENVPPPPPKWPPELGEPDLIIRVPEQHVSASGVEPYRYIFVETGLTEDKWLRAAIVKPSNPQVVHHYLVWEGASMAQMAVGLAGYVPGSERGVYPEGSGVLLHGNTPVTFNLHYTPHGHDAVDQPELALWFHKTPPPKMLITLPLVNASFTIPAGAREHEVTARIPFVDRLPYAGTLYALTPHMHYRGARMKFEVIYPDDRRETLLSVPNYDFHWQTTFELAEPKKIPAGSRLLVTGAFDNSSLNLANPDATRPVRWGEQSWEEMFIGYFDFTQD